MRRLLITLVASLVLLASTTMASAVPRAWTAHLSGDEEVPAVDTDATGQAILKIAQDGEASSTS